jgi:type IV secretion system protein VirB4
MYDSKDLAAKGIGDTILGIPSYSKFPYGNVAEYLTNQDIPFGEKRYFRFENNNKIANMISIRRYAKYLTALSLHDLFMVDAEMIYTVSFLPIERSEARKKVKKVVTAMNVTNDAGDSEMINLENLEDDILSENITLGASHVSLMVLAPNKEDLIEKTNQIQRIFGENDFQTLVEQYNHDGAFWAQFPANFQYIARSRLISSDVFCHFFPMQNFPTGHNYRTHLGEALCLVKTPSMTPMYFNFHAKGSGKSTDIKAGHLPIIGANGFGKTTFMLMMESLMEKYDIRSFIFDKNNGTEIYVEASKGKYINYDYSDDVEGIKHNPFALDDTLANREFVSRFICSMVRRKDEGYVPAKVANQIKECVDYAYNHIPKDQRRLSTAVNIGLEHNFERMDELQQFLRSDGIRADGKYAIFFDNQVESFDFNAYSKFGLDTTKLLKDPKLTGLVSYYIFTLIRMSIESVKAGQTQLTGIFIDEVADKLSDPYFSAEIDESLPILRKQNAFVVIGMQSASTLTDYENRAIILDNSATMIIAPNPTADYEVYKKLNISNAEFNWVKRTPVESRQALYKQPMTHDTAIIDLSLKGFERQLSVISGSTASVNLKRQIIKDLGTNDPDVWLPEFYKRMEI